MFVHLLLCSLAGCCAGSESAGNSPTTRNAPNGVAETYLIAKSSDLRLSIYGIKPGTKSFPYVLLMLANTSSHDVVVAYTAGAVVTHCGPYVQTGPAETIGRRRQVLEPGGFILIDPPESGWTGVTPDGQPELMIPTALPAGKYDVWASFEILGAKDGIIQSDKRMYEAR